MTGSDRTSAGPTKRALLVGINRYRNASDGGLKNLQGCLNDVADMRDLLVRKFAFPAENITILRDNAATRDGILQAIEKHVTAGNPTDVTVFYYSGHGEQVYKPGRINDKDQAIIPHDGCDQAGKILDITGEEIETAFAKMAT